MILNELIENQQVAVNNEDLIINCDIPKGVHINVTDGDVIINGSAGENVKIYASRTPRINIQINNSKLVADYAMLTPPGIKFGGWILTQNVSITGNRVLMEGQEVPIPFVRVAPVLKGKITISGDIHNTTDVRAAHKVLVNDKKMIVAQPNQDIGNSSLLLPKLLSQKNGYNNIHLLKSLINSSNINSDRPNPPLIEAIKGGNIHYVQYLIQAGANVNFETTFQTPLTTALEKGRIDIAELLIDAQCKIQPEGHLLKPILQYAEKGNCKDAFLELLKRKNIDLNNLNAMNSSAASSSSSSSSSSSAANQLHLMPQNNFTPHFNINASRSTPQTNDDLASMPNKSRW